ncbi:thermonuclease family protein [Synechococcus sp. CCAP 1479/9]|uniref:thermonuclease family protein n=1 Tax=Synechococcus sp. CCAP 1479/9 TaxID=1221593 RepID=UPI002570C22C|nr:thermonuclease family protein [Synechococcus sp. CCAP 1479/9]
MSLSLRPLAALLLAMASTTASQAALAGPEIRAMVLSIGDGDTIRVLQGQQRITIRLACIDAPEMAQAPDGANARSYLQSRLRLGSGVTLRPQTMDRYGRTVAEVIGKVNLNLALVEDGMAFAYRRYLGQCDAREYLDAEFRASRSRYGVWRVPGGITRPWDFRRGRTSGRSASTAESIPGGRRLRCREIGSFTRAQELLRQGHTYLDGNGDGVACESLR